jgi:bacillithiol biosynthesis cysteine-adding enzyme BshC
MSYSVLNRNSTKQFSAFSCAFGQQEHFSQFLQRPFSSINDLSSQARFKSNSYSVQARNTLVSELTNQLEKLASPTQLANIQALSNENTFTVTTGHQLTLFGGPLYLIYKVLHVVKLTQQFNTTQSTFKAVPVFWLASEDHDFEEVKHTNLFQAKLSWNTNQSGAVGRFNSADFSFVHDAFAHFFDGKEGAIKKLLDFPFQGDYASYMQGLLSIAFAEEGVLVINPDTRAFKQLFVPVIKRELEESKAWKAVQQTNGAIESAGYHPQAQARPINLFYLTQNARTRIEKHEKHYQLGNETVDFESLMSRVEAEPESFSPNVILRPVYQETILPNLAYVGGGGEMAYWIQLKGVFEAHQTLFPLIQQRVSIHLIDAAMKKRMEKLKWEPLRFFEPKERLRKQYLDEQEHEATDWSQVYSRLNAVQEEAERQTLKIDTAMESLTKAEFVRIRKQVESIEQKLIKHLKQRHEQTLHAIDFVVDRTIPENTLQERFFHWLHFAPDGNYPKLFMRLLEEIDPFESNLMLVDLTD